MGFMLGFVGCMDHLSREWSSYEKGHAMRAAHFWLCGLPTFGYAGCRHYVIHFSIILDSNPL